MFQIISTSGIQQCVYEIDTHKTIPMDESNSDYQAYLEWVAAGGVPEVVGGSE